MVWWPKQFRLLLSGLAYTLVNGLRRLALQGMDLAQAQVDTIRLNLFKVAVVVVKNTRRLRFLFPDSYPYQRVFSQALHNLNYS